MDLYITSLFVLIVLLVVAAYWQRQREDGNFSLFHSGEAARLETIDEELHDLDRDTMVDRFFDFRVRFLLVYGLAIAADWLQGSFMYSLYKNTHELPETVIASLFATGFLCGGISATFSGTLADRFGRKRACLWYCAIYSLSCLTVLSGNVSILFLGRTLGGVSTTLLFTVFETWMIGEYHRLGFGHSEGALSSVYSSMSILNGCVAVASGVSSQYLVHLSGSEAAPFLASVVCLGLASTLISRNWVENFGSERPASNSIWTPRPAGRSDYKSLLAIGFATCFLEGSMYIMVFYWSQAIISARELAFAWDKGNPPFGLIFANFMCALTLGSFFFAYLTRNGNSIQTSSSSAQLAMALSSACLLLTILSEAETYRFWAFCVFEFCLGVYFPSMGYLKGNLVANHQRGKIYGLMRVPLNTYIVLSLITIKEGDASRENRFFLSSGLLLLSIFFMARYVPRSNRSCE